VGSNYSISESKFGELLQANKNIKIQDIRRLIKDNFGYFKHFLGYCVCFTCDCGLCKCTYQMKDQKKILFRGAYVSLYHNSYNEDKKSQFKDENLQALNKNLVQNMQINIPTKKFGRLDKVFSLSRLPTGPRGRCSSRTSCRA
jgi:hypothetical protein